MSTLPSLLLEIIGIIGVAIIIVAYFMLQSGKLKPNSWPYLNMNLIGSILIISSLLNNWNLAGFVINTIWIIITLIGMWKKKLKHQVTKVRRY